MVAPLGRFVCFFFAFFFLGECRGPYGRRGVTALCLLRGIFSDGVICGDDRIFLFPRRVNGYHFSTITLAFDNKSWFGLGAFTEQDLHDVVGTIEEGVAEASEFWPGLSVEPVLQTVDRFDT